MLIGLAQCHRSEGNAVSGMAIAGKAGNTSGLSCSVVVLSFWFAEAVVVPGNPVGKAATATVDDPTRSTCVPTPAIP